MERWEGGYVARGFPGKGGRSMNLGDLKLRRCCGDDDNIYVSSASFVVLFKTI